LAGEIVKILQATHLLPIGKFINIKKPDVIGQHLGQTAPKAYKNLVNGIGSIVFIDEAYSFAGKRRESDGYDPFGVEFINALVDFMEEYRGLLGIIAAGYVKEMKEQFLDVNGGLNRRFRTRLNMKELDPITIITRLYEKIKNPAFFVTYYIENFIRFAYHIKQFETNQINIIVYSDRTGRYEAIKESQASYILTHYFNKLFMDNWTDILALFDYFEFNNSFDYTVEEQIQNVITEFIRSKVNSSDVLELSSRIYQENIVLQLKIKKLDWSIKSIDLLDNGELNTEQEHIDLIKHKIFSLISSATNNSDRNANVQEIEKRLNKPPKQNSDDAPPPLTLSRTNTNRNPHSLNSLFGPPPTPPPKLSRSNSSVSPDVYFSSTLAPPPPLPVLKSTNTESYYAAKYGQRYKSEPVPSANAQQPKSNSNTPPPVPSFGFSFSKGKNSNTGSEAPPLLSFSTKTNSKPSFSFSTGTPAPAAPKAAPFSFSTGTPAPAAQPKKNSNTPPPQPVEKSKSNSKQPAPAKKKRTKKVKTLSPIKEEDNEIE
jgi:hypothetical protein